MKPKKPILLAVVLFLAFLIGLPAWLMWREVRLERLNRDLIAAIKKNDTKAARTALRDGADANTQDKGETTVSARQVLQDWWDQLRGRKPSPSPIHRAALMLLFQLKLPKVPGIVRIVRGRAYGFEMPPENVPLLQALLDQRANPNARDENGDTALMLAVTFDYTASARLLLGHGTDVNARDANGRTALMLAVIMGNTKAVQLLLNRGADWQGKDRWGKTVFYYAIWSGNKDIMRLLKQNGAK